MPLKNIFIGLCFLLLIPTIGNTVEESETSSVIVINPIVIPAGRESEALAIWDKYADYFKQQPGFIGTKLHRSIDPKAKFHFINVAEWKSADDFSKALNSKEIEKVGTGFPKDMPYYPSIYHIIRNL